MRSAAELALVAVIALGPLAAAAQEPAAPEAPVNAARDAPRVPPGAVPARADVRRALDAVAADPNLAAERTVNMLRWKEAEPVTDEPWWWRWANGIARWARGLFGWVAESGRLIVWVLGGIAAGALAVYLARLVRTRGLPRMPAQFVAPSHVGDLDIRPESLPADVGAAALALWQHGEQRAALALLYRGLLSRLVHVHEVPIRDSSTEGECLMLAEQRVSSATADYASRLVAVWTGAVYGARAPAVPVVQELCAEFGRALDGGRPE